MAIWSSGCGRIELNISEDQAAAGYHPGPCDLDIADIRQHPGIAAQLAALDPGLLANVLKEYGAWNSEELAQHEENLSRILWLACADLIDQ